MKIKRYDEVRVDGSGMEPNEDGDYVRHDDHVAVLEAANRELDHVVKTRDEYKAENVRLRAELAVKP